MAKDPAFLLRQRFLKYIMKKWIMNDHNLKEISCVYVMVSWDYDNRTSDIAYIGSTTKLFSRYKSHNIPYRIQKTGNLNLMYFIPINKGFYDYEIKLIKRLQPIYNKQHKNGS